jgi:2-oxoglutarate dehydrogenase E2 component (dihydrolipoamide succinyltransferase)
LIMPTNVIMPQMGESVAEGTVTKWLKKVGERVERDEPLFEITTDKVDAEIPSPAAGVLTKILVKENETVGVNTVVGVIDGEGAEETRAAPPPAAAQKAAPEVPATPAVALPAGEPSRPAETGVRSSPVVQRLAAEHGVDLTKVRGTGLGGRVSKRDILNYIAQREGAHGVPPSPPTAAAPLPREAPAREPAIVFTGPTRVVPMTPMRRQIAEHMTLSRRTSAHVTTVFEVEMTRVADLRERAGEEFQRRYSLKLTYTPFFVRAAIEAIREFPIFNSSVEGASIVYKREVNIGMAVALETGLIVPVIKDAGEKSFVEIARVVKDLADRARSKQLSVEDVQGGTFTLTNPGVFGSLFGTPIIHQPQVAILGVGAIEKRPVVRQDAIAIRSMVYLALSFDHRIIDGAVADQFMARLKHLLEEWDVAVP